MSVLGVQKKSELEEASEGETSEGGVGAGERGDTSTRSDLSQRSSFSLSRTSISKDELNLDGDKELRQKYEKTKKMGTDPSLAAILTVSK